MNHHSSVAPKVSVLMSVYNGSQYLREAIDSILNQTFANFEFIVIDDCSTDNSWEILNGYATQDSRIVLLKNEENIGLTKSLNKGIRVAKGEYIARQDADDVSLPCRFEKQLAVLEQDSDVALVSCDVEMIHSDGTYICILKQACEPELVAWHLLFYNHIAGHSQVVFKKDLAIELGSYNEDYRYSQDYELWCRLIKVSKFVIVPEPLLRQRRHKQSISNIKFNEQHSFALAQVSLNISSLINVSIDSEKADELYNFWIRSLKSDFFIDHQKVENLHRLMKCIYFSFISKQVELHQENIKLQRKICGLIGERFFDGLNQVSFRADPITKLRLSLIIFFWCPKIIYGYYFFMLPQRISQRIPFRKRQKFA